MPKPQPPSEARPAGAQPQRSARGVVCRRLSHQAAAFPELDIAPLETDGLDPRDAALAHAIYDAVIRRWFTLSFLLGTRLTQPLTDLESRLQGVLLAGAAQLLLLDRVPPHAAINEAVQWAKTNIRPGAGALVNAVLRKVSLMRTDTTVGGGSQPRRERWTGLPDEIPLHDGAALPLLGVRLPEDEAERLAVATSHPRSLLFAWSRAFGRDGATALALHGLATPPVTLNTASARAPLPESLRPHTIAGHHIFTGSRHELVDLLGSRDDLWVQDAASTRAVARAAHLRPTLIIDACAGQGTKTRQLAATFPDAAIIATDTDLARLRTLAEVFRGHARVEVVGPASLAAFRGRADLVLLDAPCSNTGVLARRVEARYRCSEEQLRRLIDTQRRIITDSVPLLSDTGRILYSTCSLEVQEDEDQTRWAQDSFALSVELEARHMPQGGPGHAPDTYTDGSYMALLNQHAGRQGQEFAPPPVE